MKCPHCTDTTLVMSDRQGVEIDYCPQCRGVWLDRGELDKLIERSARQEFAPQQPAVPQPVRRPDFEDSDYRKHHGGYPRRKSWLSDIFD
ncbi:MAG TPA: zf-TFIIB domain-containing protein [Rhizobacter sp.]